MGLKERIGTYGMVKVKRWEWEEGQRGWGKRGGEREWRMMVVWWVDGGHLGNRKAWLDQSERFSWARHHRRRHINPDWIHTRVIFKGFGFIWNRGTSPSLSLHLHLHVSISPSFSLRLPLGFCLFSFPLCFCLCYSLSAPVLLLFLSVLTSHILTSHFDSWWKTPLRYVHSVQHLLSFIGLFAAFTNCITQKCYFRFLYCFSFPKWATLKISCVFLQFLK